MSEMPPYLNGYGYIATVLEKIKSAPTPPKFTQDFLSTNLGVTSSSARPIIPFLRKIGFLDQNSAPTLRYQQFRNPALSKQAAADGLKQGYSTLYSANEYAHELPAGAIEGFIMQVCGLQKSSSSLNAIVGSFNALKSFADFVSTEEKQEPSMERQDEVDFRQLLNRQNIRNSDEIGRKLNISYTINLNLPGTTNIEVFDAIFTSLEKNILKSNG